MAPCIISGRNKHATAYGNGCFRVQYEDLNKPTQRHTAWGKQKRPTKSRVPYKSCRNPLRAQHCTRGKITFFSGNAKTHLLRECPCCWLISLMLWMNRGIRLHSPISTPVFGAAPPSCTPAHSNERPIMNLWAALRQRHIAERQRKGVASSQSARQKRGQHVA